MTREEQIEEFIKFHAHKFSVRYGYETIEELMREMAQWCDNNPKNPWKDVKEQLPPELEPVIVMFGNGIIINAFMTMVKDEPAWYPSVEIPIGSDVLFWMNMPELPKEE